MNYWVWALLFFTLSIVLNQITGSILGRHPINVFALVVIPLIFSFWPDETIKRGAKVALLPGVLLLVLYYVVRPLLL